MLPSLLVVCVVNLLSAPAARSQATWFDWRIHPGSELSQVIVSVDGLHVSSGVFDPVGTFLGATTMLPIAGQITTGVYNDFHEGDGYDPVLKLGRELTVLPDPPLGITLVIDVPAASAIGFGMLSVSAFGYADVYFSPFTFAPPPSVVPGTEDDSAFGSALANLGDLTGDGIDDLAVGAPTSLASGTAAGRVVLVSGADGSVIRTIDGDPLADGFGSVVAAAGDVDGDGLSDVVVGAPLSDLGGVDAGLVRVHSSADGALRLELSGAQAGERFGAAIAGLGDLDGDGQPEICVGAPGADRAGIDSGRAVVLHADGTTVFEVAGPSAQADLGWCVAAAGDLSGDGVTDVLVGAPGEDFDQNPGPGRGAVRLYSGALGTLLYKFKGEWQGGRFGRSLAAGRDLDGDGTPDLLVGQNGSTLAFSGATKLELFAPIVQQYLALAMTDDLDGDARPDFAIGSASGADVTGGVRFYSGRDAARLAVFYAPSAATGFGFALCAAGDSDGDGLDEVAIGAPGADGAGSHAGAVFVHDLFVHWFDVGHALSGDSGTPRLQGDGLPYAGLPISLRLTAAPPSSAALLVLGTSHIDLPFKGGVLVPSLDRIVGGLVTDSAGELALSSQWPAGLPAGLELFFQFWIVEAAGASNYAASNGLRVAVP